MKILYVANDRRAAELAAFAIATLPGVLVGWAEDLDKAQQWVETHRDIAALIVEVTFDTASCEAFVSRVRGLGVTAPIVIVSLKAPVSSALEVVADAIVAKGPSFLKDLPDVLNRVLPRPRLRALYIGDASLARQCAGSSGSVDIAEVVPAAGQTFDSLPVSVGQHGPLAFDVVFLEYDYPGVDAAAVLKDLAASQLHVPAVIVADWNEEMAGRWLKLGAVDYVVKSETSFRAFLFRIDRVIEHSTLVRERAEWLGAVARYKRLEQKLSEAEAERQRAEQIRTANASSLAEQLARKEAEYREKIAQAARERQAADELLARTEGALQRADERHQAEMQAAAAELREQQAAFEARLAQAAAERLAADKRLEDALASIEEMRRARPTDAAIDATEQVRERRAALESELSHLKTKQGRLERRVADADTALRYAEQRAAEQYDLRAQATERLAEIEADLSRERTNADALKAQLAAAHLARQRADAEHAAETQAAAGRLMEYQAASEARLLEAGNLHDTLRTQLAAAEAALRRSEEQRAADVREAAARLAEREQERDQRLREAGSAIAALERTVDETEAALRRVEQQALADRQAAVDEAALRQTRFEAELNDAAARREALARQLAEAEAALREAERQRASEITAAAAHLAEYQQRVTKQLAEAAAVIETRDKQLAEAAAAFDRAKQRHGLELAEAAARLSDTEKRSREMLAKAVADANAERQRAEERHALEIAAASTRFTEYQTEATARLTQALVAADALQTKLADAAGELDRVRQQAETERQAASQDARRRQADFDAELAQAASLREALEQALAERDGAYRTLEEQHISERTAAAARLADAQRDAEAKFAAAAGEAAAALETFERNAGAAREAAAAQAAERESALKTALSLALARCAAVEKELADTRSASEDAEVRRRAEYAALQQAFDESRVSGQTALENMSKDHAAERARLQALVDERQRQLGELEALKQASDEAAAKALAEVEDRFRLTLEAGRRDAHTIETLHDQLKTLVGQLDATRSERDALKNEADRVPLLCKQMDDIKDENRRRFEHAPVPMFRCTRSGAVTHVSRALAKCLEYDSPEALEHIDFAATVFQSGDELQWIINRCLASGSSESLETAWKTKHGGRLVVRVVARATTADSIDVAAQDITVLRELEEKLRNSQRMEAVARYASEIAVTCDNLLRHVEREGQQWLSTIDGDTARYHGELLLNEVTRAAKYLQQLAVYGNEQKNVPDLVDLTKVLRDLEPVLKRVAGSDIEVVLPKTTAPLNLDVEVERVERMLVNVAAYGRERMPLGGRLTFEVAPVVVDRTFVEKHPNVRPGAHVLLTVNEVRRATPRGMSAAIRGHESGAQSTRSNHPGVDLGTLQALVSGCGGHLWMMAEPPGDMVLKIHLPRRVLDRPDSRARREPKRARLITPVSS